MIEAFTFYGPVEAQARAASIAETTRRDNSCYSVHDAQNDMLALARAQAIIANQLIEIEALRDERDELKAQLLSRRSGDSPSRLTPALDPAGDSPHDPAQVPFAESRKP